MKYVLWLAALAACGHSSSSTPDSGSPDGAAADVSTVGFGPITVFAPYPPDSGSEPYRVRPGATALFYDGAGNLVDRQVTGADGTATGMGPPNATVAVTPPPGVTASNFAWVGVAPGDHLYTYHRYDSVPDSQQVSLIVPRDGDDVTEYAATSASFGALTMMPPATGNITLTGWLHPGGPATGDLVVAATHANHHTRFIVVHDAAFDGNTIDLSSATWSEPTPFDLTINTVTDTRWLTASYSRLADNKPIWYGDAYASVPGGTLPVHLDSPGPVGDGSALSLLFQRHLMPDSEYWAGSFNQVPDPVDLPALIVEPSSIAAQGGAITWDADGDPTRALGIGVGVETPSQYWAVVVPPDRRSFVPPPLPADLGANEAPTGARVYFVSGNDPAGYAAVRTDPDVFNLYQYGQVMPATPGVYRLAGD